MLAELPFCPHALETTHVCAHALETACVGGRAHLRRLQVDEDKGGSISPQELGSLMETLGLKPNQEELDAMIREIDEDGNGEIEFDEFVQVVLLLLVGIVLATC